MLSYVELWCHLVLRGYASDGGLAFVAGSDLDARTDRAVRRCYCRYRVSTLRSNSRGGKIRDSALCGGVCAGIAGS
jgi:hypothetical protein